jgi:aspartyl-tRNA(Asn)/glutamyl-tRNA(Gln) amidotransferase subunit C
MTPARPPIAPALVHHLAALAQLELDDEEAARTVVELERILDYVTKLAELDTTTVPATAQALTVGPAWREDEPLPSLPLDASLRAAPERRGDAFGVPRPID